MEAKRCTSEEVLADKQNVKPGEVRKYRIVGEHPNRTRNGNIIERTAIVSRSSVGISIFWVTEILSKWRSSLGHL